MLIPVIDRYTVYLNTSLCSIRCQYHVIGGQGSATSSARSRPVAGTPVEPRYSNPATTTRAALMLLLIRLPLSLLPRLKPYHHLPHLGPLSFVGALKSLLCWALKTQPQSLPLCLLRAPNAKVIALATTNGGPRRYLTLSSDLTILCSGWE
jgi:hypothetical protein